MSHTLWHFFRRTVWKGKKIIKHMALLLLLRCCWFTYGKMAQGTMMGPALVSVTSCWGQAVSDWTLPLKAPFVFHMWALVWAKKKPKTPHKHNQVSFYLTSEILRNSQQKVFIRCKIDSWTEEFTEGNGNRRDYAFLVLTLSNALNTV